MSKPFFYSSIIAIALTILWLTYEFQLHHFVRWHFLAAGGLHFIMSIIINRQFTIRTNVLGWIHVSLAVIFFAYGYFLL
ncbi:hypothetical protein [Nonlabens sp. Hel1_33_55]|uniref:hypothetical protein n=1 Tax=Nonlabens sp. Hel1_33_55 TaxID=1336802 RepID=UPI0012FDFD18|nr:hypothetical protein [Nonlabens sp. Hel1_33_55]